MRNLGIRFAAGVLAFAFGAFLIFIANSRSELDRIRSSIKDAERRSGIAEVRHKEIQAKIRAIDNAISGLIDYQQRSRSDQIALRNVALEGFEAFSADGFYVEIAELSVEKLIEAYQRVLQLKRKEAVAVFLERVRAIQEKQDLWREELASPEFWRELLKDRDDKSPHRHPEIATRRDPQRGQCSRNSNRDTMGRPLVRF